MKEDVLKKIHVLGKVGRIVSKVMSIICRIAAVILGVVYLICMIEIYHGFNVVIERNNHISITVPEESHGIVIGEIDDGGSFTVQGFGSEYTFYDDIEVDGNNMYLTSSNQPEELSVTKLTELFIFAGLMIAASLVSLKFAGRFCAELEKCESPFQNEIIDNMRKFAISLIPWIVCNTTFRSTLTSFLLGADDISIDIDFACVAIVLIVIILTMIFRYGALLQQESDETL